MFKWLGLIVTLFIWLGLAALLTKWRNQQLRSISAHGSSAKGAARLFRILLVGGGLVYYWWLVGWFVPRLDLPGIFTVLLTIVIAYQLATGLNNGTTGISKHVHVYTAQTMSLLYIPLAVLILESPRLGLLARVLCVALTVYLVNSFVIIEVMKGGRAKHLVFQLAYIVSFQLLILMGAYVRV